MLSLRERLAAHRANPSCASCHTLMDSVGFALEGFDATGRWRTIDELGLPDRRLGRACPTAALSKASTQFRAALLSSEQFRIVLAEKLMVYALGTRRRALRHAGGARHRARRRGRGASLLAVHSRRRQQHAVSDEEGGAVIVTKRALPRRTFLKGAGAAIGLPLLDAMVPAFAAEAPKAKRIGFVYLPNGVAKNFTGIDYWTPKSTGKLSELSTILAPLAPYRDRLTVDQRHRSESGAKPTPRTARRAITRRRTRRGSPGVRCKRTEGADIECGVSADQLAAQVLGKETVLPSLELSIDLSVLAGMCDSAYSCVYLNTLVVEHADDAAAEREQSARRLRALVRQRRHERAARGAGAPGPQHPRFRRRRFRALDARARARGPRAGRRVSRVRARGRAANSRRSSGSATRPGCRRSSARPAFRRRSAST